MAPAGLAFADSFPAVSEADWRALVERSLQGADFEKKLCSRTISGQRIEPIYARPQSVAAQPMRAAGRWRIVQREDIPSIEHANRQILTDLQGGADAIELVFDTSSNATGSGLSVRSLGELDRLLSDVMLDMIALHIDGGHQNRALLSMFLALAEQRHIKPEALDLVLYLDPIGVGLKMGRIPVSDRKFIARMKDLIEATHRHHLRARLVMVESEAVHAAGGSEIQELAFCAATLVNYLRLLEQTDTPFEDLPKLIGVRMAADANQHLTIAKFRAMRRIWARILQATGLPDEPLYLHAETAWRMMTRNDAHVNMLRTTMATFAAGIGGADSITVRPYSAALGLPDAEARRIARNTQSVLMDESNLHRVSDPAAGSGAIEALTVSLTEQAWSYFQRIEATGGIVDSIVNNRLQSDIAAVAAARAEQIARRALPLTGVSEFATLNEPNIPVGSQAEDLLTASGDRIDLPEPSGGELFEAHVEAAKAGANLIQMAVSRGEDEPRNVNRAFADRLAEPYEVLRAAADQYYRVNGDRPCIHLTLLGKPSQFQARSSFMINALAAGGIAGKTGVPVTAPHEAADDFAAGGLSVACLCSSDELYGEIGTSVVEALRSVGASYVIVAGRPRGLDDALREAGVSDFVYAGCDLIQVLQELHIALNIQAAKRETESGDLA